MNQLGACEINKRIKVNFSKLVCFTVKTKTMEEEIEILKSIYFDDITRVDMVDRLFEIVIYPLEDEQDRQKYLRLNMITYFTANVIIQL